MLAGIVCAFAQQGAAAQSGTFKEQVLHSFGDVPDGAAPEAGLIDVKGTLYGTTEQGGAHNAGAVYSFDLSTGTETVLYSFCSQQDCSDGWAPEAGLIDVGGVLYGTAYATNTNGGGARSSHSTPRPVLKNWSIPFAAGRIAPTAPLRPQA